MMRVSAVTVVLALGSMTGPLPLPAQTQAGPDTAPVVVTSGTGEVSLSPDRAVLRFEVQTRGSTAAQASHDNSVTLRAVLDSLNASQVPGESTLVVAVSVRPNENYQSGTLSGYSASSIVRVTIRSLSRLSAVLDRALGSGATGVQNIEFHSDHEEAARLDALAEAFRRSQADAEALARAAGEHLGPLVRLSTEPQFGLAFSGVSAGGEYGSVTISPSDVRVTAHVQGTWRLLR